MPTELLISNILLWLVVIILCFVVYALTRQIGILYERVAPAGALAINQKLSVGDAAPFLQLTTITGQSISIASPSNQKSQLIIFISPDCPMCKTLLPIIISCHKAESEWVDIILASDGDETNQQVMIKEHKLEGFPFVLSQKLGKQYAVAKLPYAVLIDEQAKISSFGLVNTREHLESLFEAKERNVSSLQEFLTKKHKSNS